MKTRTITIVLIFVLIVIGALEWFGHSPQETANLPSSAFVQPHIIQSPLSIKPSSSIAAPIARPVSAPAPQPTSATLPDTPSHPAIDASLKDELNTTIAGIAALFQSGDVLTITKTYTAPEDLAKISPEVMAQMERSLKIQANNPDTQQIFRAMGEAYALLKDQNPVINAAGDEATYQLTVPPGSLPSGMSDPPPRSVIFRKIGGEWYLKDDAENQ